MRYCYIIPLREFLLPALFVLASLSLNAQTSAQTSATSSPYSRFALGRPENTGFSEVTALGGSYTAFRNDTNDRSTFFVNQGNPSSYVFNKFTTYSFGARYSFYNYSGENGNVKKQNGGFNYISLAFPIRKKMGAAFGLVPFSNVGYNVTTTTEKVDSIGSITSNYQGSGGINQAYGGVAVRPFEARYHDLVRSDKYKYLDSIARSDAPNSGWAQGKLRRMRFAANALSNFSVGSNISFLYGTINYATRKYFPAAFGSVFNTCDATETRLHDVYFQGGAQISFDINSMRKKNLVKVDTLCYNENDSLISVTPCRNNSGVKTHYKVKRTYNGRAWKNLDHKVKITFGYSISFPRNVAATASHVGYNFTLASYNREIPFDTFSYNGNFYGKVKIPMMQSFGVGIKKGNYLTVLADVGYQQWSQFSFLGTNQDLKDQWRFSGGIQYQPNRLAYERKDFFKRAFYRVGGRYNTGYLFLKGNHINEYAVSAGIGLPVGRYRVSTVVNLTAEYGVAGTTQNSLIQEKFLRFVVGFTFNDRWFVKPKYD